jgi:heme A synthase
MIWVRIKREPAVVLGLVATVALTAAQVSSGDLTWEAAVPLVVGAITRQFVSPVSDK